MVTISSLEDLCDSIRLCQDSSVMFLCKHRHHDVVMSAGRTTTSGACASIAQPPNPSFYNNSGLARTLDGEYQYASTSDPRVNSSDETCSHQQTPCTPRPAIHNASVRHDASLSCVIYSRGCVGKIGASIP